MNNSIFSHLAVAVGGAWNSQPLYGTTVLVCRNRGCISVSDPDPAFLKSEKPYVVLYIRLFFEGRR